MSIIKDKYKPYIVYENIPELLKYRKLKLIHGLYHKTKSSIAMLPEDKFVEHIQYYHHVIIECADNNKNRRPRKNNDGPVKTFIVITNLDNYYNTSTNFNKLLEGYPNGNIDLLIITPNGSNVNTSKSVISANTDTPTGFFKVAIYPYHYFYIVVPKHRAVSPMHIIPHSLEQEYLDRIYAERKGIPVLRANDVLSVWLGAEPGDLVQIDNISEIGIEVMYKRVG